jgi:hypothetical protein
MTQATENTAAQPAKFAKGVDLITANVMHELLSAAHDLQRLTGRMMTPEQLAEGAARQLLCSISHGAKLELVFLALGAVGAPGSAEECAQRLRAALEAGAAQ